jgi:uncharacterized protein YkwD
MSRTTWLRRSVAAVATAGALAMAFQSPALATTIVHRYGNVVTHYTWDPTTTSYKPIQADRGSDTPTRPVADRPASDTATRILELTNAERSKAGLEPLRRHDCLTTGAQQWSEQMRREDRMYHSSLGGWMRSCDLNRVGENVARGGRTAERTVQMWMDSPGHRANILNPRFTELGVGWAADGSFATQRFGG